MNKRWSKLVLSFTLVAFLMGATLVPAVSVSAAPAQQPVTQMAPMMDKDKMMGMMKDMMMSPEMKPMMMDMMKEMMQSPEMNDMMMKMMEDMMSKHAVDTPQQPVDHTKHQ